MTTASGMQRKFSKLKNDLEKAAKRGVHVRIAAPSDESVKKLAKQFPNFEVRHTDKDARFCSIDGKDLVVMLTNDKDVHESFDSGIWINTPYFVNHFDRMFDRDWKEMKKA